MSDFVIREANTEDAEKLVEIYSYYVLNTAVSFEYEVPGVEEFRERIRNRPLLFSSLPARIPSARIT